MPEEGIRLLDRFSDEVHDLIMALRARVFVVAPRATEVVTDVGYTVALRYGPSPRAAGQFVYVTGFSAHANLGFVEGASLPNPAGVLEANGIRMRHVKRGRRRQFVGACPSTRTRRPQCPGCLRGGTTRIDVDGRKAGADQR